MSLSSPFVACPLRPHIPVELAALTERSRSRLSDADKKAGAQLLADAYCDLLDHFLTDMLHEVRKTHPSHMMDEALHMTEEVKAKIHHYLGWIVGFLSNARLVPVIAHFNGLVHEMELHGQRQHFVAFPVSPALAANGKRVLAQLHTGTLADIGEGMELLIQAVEEGLEPLALTPKALMKFNFVVDKTLNGVISLIMSLFNRMLRKMGPHLPRDLYPQIAVHLERFLIVA
ncbi:MAG: hypothetical protein Q8J78_02385 [Moraxellaceae bacterium]|nr:hypothetical protein [Moraxellaceae bacterium]